MAKYELNDIEHKNLIAFLGRTNLTGAEVQEFNKIVYALSRPIPEETVAETESK